VIRRLNFTGRRKIPRGRITIRLHVETEDRYAFSADYDLAGLRFPADASVLIEAYNAISYMRFDFGTVGTPHEPPDLRLSDVTPRPLPKFRLKVVDRSGHTGLLLGVADQIVALRAEQDLRARQPLLPVDFCDLGERVWRLDLSDWPVLELNQRIDGIVDEARSGDDFLALVYPEVVRQILRATVIEQEQTDPDFDDTHWTSLWLRYVCELPGVGRPPQGLSQHARTDREEWVEDAVQAFCHAREVRRRYAAAVAHTARAEG